MRGSFARGHSARPRRVRTESDNTFEVFHCPIVPDTSHCKFRQRVKLACTANRGGLVDSTMLDMKLFMVIWMVSGLGGCTETAVTCDEGRSWNEFYESCVDPCPAHQDYDADGICTDIAPGTI